MCAKIKQISSIKISKFRCWEVNNLKYYTIKQNKMPYRHTVKKSTNYQKWENRILWKMIKILTTKVGLYKASISFITYIYVFAKKNKMLNFLFFSEWLWTDTYLEIQSSKGKARMVTFKDFWHISKRTSFIQYYSNKPAICNLKNCWIDLNETFDSVL